MAKVLKVEIADDSCVDGETYHYILPVDHSYSAAAEAAETLYPSMTSLHIYVDDAEDT